VISGVTLANSRGVIARTVTGAPAGAVNETTVWPVELVAGALAHTVGGIARASSQTIVGAQPCIKSHHGCKEDARISLCSNGTRASRKQDQRTVSASHSAVRLEANARGVARGNVLLTHTMGRVASERTAHTCLAVQAFVAVIARASLTAADTLAMALVHAAG